MSPDDINNMRINLKTLTYHMSAGHADPDHFNQNMAQMEGLMNRTDVMPTTQNMNATKAVMTGTTMRARDWLAASNQFKQSVISM